MAIQNRRGDYNALDTSKLVAGEWAFALSGDEHAEDGKAVYAAFAPGDVKRMATYEDMEDQVAEAMEAVSVPRGGETGQMLIKNSDADYDLSWGALTAGVTSFNERFGSVEPEAGDYSADMITYGATNVKAELDGRIKSFKGRTGAVTPAANDYSADQIKFGTNSNVNAELNARIKTFKGRSGAVVPTKGDYTAFQVTYGESTVGDELNGNVVKAFKGRHGSVTPQANDYTSAQVSHAGSSVKAALDNHEDLLTTIFKKQSFVLEDNLSITGGGTYAQSYEIAVPENYRILSLWLQAEAATSSGGNQSAIIPYYVKPAASSVSVRLRNISTGNAKIKLSAEIIFVKSIFFYS